MTIQSDLDAVMLIESLDYTREELIEAFQFLINSGTAWKLQGSYGRTADLLIKQGLCTDRQPT